MFNNDATDQIREFRHWRASLESLNTMDALEEVQRFWTKAPLSNQFYSADYPSNWPTPWALIQEGLYDEVSLGLAMFYSLALMEEKCYNSLNLVACRDCEGLKLCVLVDNCLLLNCIWGELVNTEHTDREIKIEKTYEISDFEALT